MMEKLVGPCFKPEVQQVVDIEFGETGCVVVSEEVFASRFRNDYRAHLHVYWMDKMRCYFLQRDWIGRVFKSESERGFCTDWFSMHEINMNGRRGLKINMAITANRFHEARLIQDIQELFPLFDLRIGLPFFNGTDKKTHLGDTVGEGENSGAYQRYLAEHSCKNACLQ